MTNNKKSSVDYLISQLQKSKDWHRVLNEVSQMSSARVDIIAEAKAMQQEQAQVVDFTNPNADKIISGSTQAPMSNNKQSSVEQLAIALYENGFLQGDGDEIDDLLLYFKVMQQEQAQLYASFVLKCVQNNLPPITFNDWINLGNNENQ